MTIRDHSTFQGTGRLRRCLALASILYASLWLIHLVPPTTGARPQWLQRASAATVDAAIEHSNRVPRAKIGKVTMAYDYATAAYERALASHAAHARQHGYPMHVLEQPLLHGIWSKLAYLMSVIMNELQKPPAERLEWVFWYDADSYVLNPHVKLETFLPPDTPAFANASFLVADDARGLQAGVFFLRVDSWAIELLSAAIALPRYRPDLRLKFFEQTALQFLAAPLTKSTDVTRVSDDEDANYFEGRHVRIPQHWCNAYIGPRRANGTLDADRIDPLRKLPPGVVRAGDLLVHFAGTPEFKQANMEAFTREAERHPAVWVRPLEQTGLVEEAEAFWQRWEARYAHPIQSP